MKKFKVYTQFPSGRLYLGDQGADLIIEANSEGEALREVVSWIYETSNYSEEMTSEWIDSHSLYLEEYEGDEAFFD